MDANASAGLGNLRVVRMQCGMSQQALAQRAGCSLSYLRLLEAGYRPAEGRVALRVLAALTSVSEQQRADNQSRAARRGERP